MYKAGGLGEAWKKTISFQFKSGSLKYHQMVLLSSKIHLLFFTTPCPALQAFHDPLEDRQCQKLNRLVKMAERLFYLSVSLSIYNLMC